MGPSSWLAGLSSIRHGLGRPVGDPLMLAGSFVVHGADVIAADIAEHSGSVPDLDRLVLAAASATS